MKDAYELLRQKEADLARIRREVDSLRVAATLLDETKPGSSEDTFVHEHEDVPPDQTQATGTDGLFASAQSSRPGFWDTLKGKR